MNDKLLKQGYEAARKICEKHAKTFYFASHFLPLDRRLAAYVIYSVCRLTDDAVDIKGSSDIVALNKDIELSYSDNEIKDPILYAFSHTVKTFNIPSGYFYELTEGMRMDTNRSRYANFDELYVYCYRVAGVIGLMMNKLFMGRGELAENCAIELGVAMQLTNILRDIKEDISKGRIYIPQNELEEFEVLESDLKSCKTKKNFERLMRFQIQRARKYYKNSLAGIPYLDGASSRMVVMAMREMYEAILDEIEKEGCNVLYKRAFTSSFKKLWILIKVFVKGNYLKAL